MFRSALCVSAILTIGCASSQSADAAFGLDGKPGPTAMDATPIPIPIPMCVKDQTEEYGCDGFCPVLEDDVRRAPGFHVIGTTTMSIEGVEGSRRKVLHVADTCQHFFCQLDPSCLKTGKGDTECMRPTRCLLVYKL